MSRSPLQKGPARDHYHDRLGVDQALVETLLGPFHVAFDTPGFINTAGIRLLDLPAGSFVRAEVVITTTFNQPGELDVSVDNEDQTDGYLLVGVTDPTRLSTNSVGNAGTESLGNRSRGGTVDIDARLDAAFFPSGTDPTAGAADIYVRIATPAPS